jgi:hypothetical protein
MTLLADVDLGENPYHEFTVHASFSVSPCLNLNFRCRDVAFALLRRKEMCCLDNKHPAFQENEAWQLK